MNIYDYEINFEKEILERANKLLVCGDVIRICEDEPQVFGAEIKAQINGTLDIMLDMETDEKGNVVDFHCTCDDYKPCVHMAAIIMGLDIIETMACDDINNAVSKALIHKK